MKQLEKTIKKAGLGISEKVVRMISEEKNEPKWMLEKRLRALEIFYKLPMPGYGPSLDKLNLDEICFYHRANEINNLKSWDDVPKEIKETFDKLGIPEAEKAQLAGVGAQYESENVYHNLKEKWSRKGVIFEDLDLALQKYPDIVKEHFMNKCVSIQDHKFAALHAAVWSGGTFLYIPKGVKVDQPIQSYFRMNAARGGQFEHTMIIIEEGAEAHYIEGCSAPIYGINSLHAGCVEVFVGKNARFRYSSVENWSKDVYNLNTKRAIVEEDAIMEWVGGNFGSAVTMLYPCSILKGDRSRADHLSVAYAGKGQNQDTGGKIIHVGKNTSGQLISKSISSHGGINHFRGLIKVLPNATNAKSFMNCDNLLLDRESKSDATPVLEDQEFSAELSHEARVGSINKEELFYLMSRGIPEKEAIALIIQGFIEPIVKELPLEYAVELNRMMELEMEAG